MFDRRFCCWSKRKTNCLYTRSYGSTAFINPTLKTNSICPTAKILFTANLSKKDSSTISFYSSAGFSYTDATQTLTNQFVIIDNTTQFVASEKCKVLEFAINIGGGLHYNITKCMFLNLGIMGQIGADYIGNEFYQFYILGKLQLGVKLSKRISFITSFSSRFFLGQGDVSVTMPIDFYNYAPVKLTSNAGLQLKLFK